MEYSEQGIIDVNREHAGSSFLAYFNVVCVIAGTGTLGLPYVRNTFFTLLAWLLLTNNL